jgi:hypothetical protein
MSNNYITYKRFNDISIAQSFAEKLTESGIENEIEDHTKLSDINFARTHFGSHIDLKIDANNFIKADKILEAFYQKEIDNVPEDYYLHTFTDEELRDIIMKPDEWGHFDYLLAQKILTAKGKGMSMEEIKLIKFRRDTELAEPESTNYTWIILGYLISIVWSFFSVLGGFTGFFVGWAFAFSKKTLPDGQMVYRYSEEQRKQGMFLMIFSPTLVFVMYFLVFSYFKK